MPPLGAQAKTIPNDAAHGRHRNRRADINRDKARISSMT
jgi:hypothetical protein